MLNLNVITILMKWRQLKLIHWDTNYFAQSFTSLSDPRLTVRVPPLMKIHLHDNNSEHSECSTLVRTTKAANLGIKAFELDSRSTECRAHWKYFLFYFFIYYYSTKLRSHNKERLGIKQNFICKSNNKINNIDHYYHPKDYWEMKSRTIESCIDTHTNMKIKLKILYINIILMEIHIVEFHGWNENIKYHYHDEKMWR